MLCSFEIVGTFCTRISSYWHVPLKQGPATGVTLVCFLNWIETRTLCY